MPGTDFPYLTGVGRIGDIFEKIRNARTPPKFTLEFLKTNLGFQSSTDRAIIPVLKNLGFLGSDGDAHTALQRVPRARREVEPSLRRGCAMAGFQSSHERSTRERADVDAAR